MLYNRQQKQLQWQRCQSHSNALSISTFVVLLLLILLTIWTDSTAAAANSNEILLTTDANTSACAEKMTPGLCGGKYLRYAFNALTGNCEAFYYTGCGSSANNFLTFEECRRDCMQKLRY